VRAPSATGLVLDAVVGDPLDANHPVAWFGRAMAHVEGVLYSDEVTRGALHCAIGVALGVSAGAVLGSSAPATALAVAVAAGGRQLATTATSVARALESGDLEGARRMLPSLVGRDPQDLDDKEMARAVVESVAENTVDAVVAPALWGAVFGARGALGYRAVNTMDAMVGHRSTRYLHYGRASARLDDAANWVPARATAALVALVRPGRRRAIWRAVRHQALSHPSPNAGVAEAAFAAALGVRLGGTNRYGERLELRPALGDGPAPVAGDIHRAVRLSRQVTMALGATLLVAGRRP